MPGKHVSLIGLVDIRKDGMIAEGVQRIAQLLSEQGFVQSEFHLRSLPCRQ